MVSSTNGLQRDENRSWSKNALHGVRKTGRRKGRARLRVEALESRTMLSITSTITIINNSGFTLTFAGENFENGTHDLNARPNSIPSGSTASWQVGDGSGFLGAPVGVVGSTTWNIGNTGDQDVFNLDFPIVGSNSASQALSDNSTNYFSATQFWSGNDPTFTLAINPGSANSGVWGKVTPTIPNGNDGAMNMLLLPDGTVMIHGYGRKAATFPNNASANWYLLTPDASGNYAGTDVSAITTMAAMATARRFFATNVLPNDTVFAYGGEDTGAGLTVEANSGEYFTLGQSTSTPWGTLPTLSNALLQSGQFGDQGAVLLNDGTLLTADPQGTGTFVFTPPNNQNDATGTWSAVATGAGQASNNTAGDNEDNWVMLPNGDVLDYEIKLTDASAAGNAFAQRYVLSGNPLPGGGGTSKGQWVNASSGLIPLTSSTQDADMGPGLLLPFYAPFNGPAAMYIGANGSTAFYNPANNTWTTSNTNAFDAPPTYNIPGGAANTQMASDDGPAAILPNGEALIALSPIGTTGGPSNGYPGPTQIYLFNPSATTGASGSAFTPVTPSDGQLAITANNSGNAFNESMLALPTGQILMSDSTTTLWVYTPTGTTAAPVAGSQPIVSTITTDPANGLLQIKGSVLNGIDEGAYYGDDEGMDSNYPIVRLTDSSGNVTYATTSNWTPGLGGSAGTSTDFTLPAGKNVTDYTSVTVIANGIASTSLPLGGITLSGSQLIVNAGVLGTGSHTITIGESASGGVQAGLDFENQAYGPGQVTSIVIESASGANTINLQTVPPGVTSITVQGAGTTTLEAPSGVVVVWHNTGVGSGNLDIGSQVGIVTFTGITNELGGGTDDFMFQGGSVPGFVDGGTGPGVASLDYGSLSGPVTVNMATATAADIGGTFKNINNFIGSASSADLLIGQDSGPTWNVNGSNSGSVSGSTFSSFENLTGGLGNDRFVFFPGGSVSGNIDGGGGTNTLDDSNLAGLIAVNLQTDTAPDIGGRFSNIGNFIGSASSTDTLIGPDSGATWNVNGANSGTVNGLTFSLFENLTGGLGNDRFVFFPGGSVSGNIDGGGGTNTLDDSNLAGPIAVNLQTDTAPGIGGTFSNIGNFIGSASSTDTLIGPDSGATWNVNGMNSGTANGLTFSSFENLTGGLGTDQFVFFPGGSVSGNIDGGGGVNTLDYSHLSTPVAVNLQTSSSTGIGGTYTHITNFIGGSGSNTVIGPDANTVWTLTGLNMFTVIGLAFSGFQNITGGSGDDRFVFFPGGSVSGNIDGGGGVNTLDYSHLSTPVTVNLQTSSSTGIGGTYTHITNFIGGSGSNTVIGPDANTVWTLTGLNMFTVIGLGFSGFQNITGGSGDDRFVFETGGGVTGIIDGGGGNNTLDYSQFVGNIVVNLALGSVTGVAGGVMHVENIVGSIGNDLMVGDALSNTFVGGTGRNVLIGGLGADQLRGGGGDNILIGGTTAYDTNMTALDAIIAEWYRTDLSFEQRLADLNSDGPPSRALNGRYSLSKKTVYDDNSSNVLTGGGGLDWFLYDMKEDSLYNIKPQDHRTGVH